MLTVLFYIFIHSSFHCTKLYCQTVLPAEKYFSDAVTGGFQYSLGNDWDSVLPGAAVLMTSMGLQATAARAYLENSLLAKWEVRMTALTSPHLAAAALLLHRH
jgi:hypothetical protein